MFLFLLLSLFYFVLGLCAQEQGRLEDAHRDISYALDIRLMLFPRDHSCVWGARHHLAVALSALGNTIGALSLLQDVKESYHCLNKLDGNSDNNVLKNGGESDAPDQDPDSSSATILPNSYSNRHAVADASLEMSVCLHSLGQYADAEAAAVEALGLYRGVFTCPTQPTLPLFIFPDWEEDEEEDEEEEEEDTDDESEESEGEGASERSKDADEDKHDDKGESNIDDALDSLVLNEEKDMTIIIEGNKNKNSNNNNSNNNSRRNSRKHGRDQKKKAIEKKRQKEIKKEKKEEEKRIRERDRDKRCKETARREVGPCIPLQTSDVLLSLGEYEHEQ